MANASHPNRETTPIRRLLVVVVAEASPQLTRRFIDEGKLPTLASMWGDGLTGVVRSAFPLSTVERWCDLMTGADASRHGIFDVMQRRDNGSVHEVSRLDVRAPTLWQIASDAGLRAGAVNVPLAYPPERLSGFVIAGHDAPGDHRSIAMPPALHTRLAHRFGDGVLAENYFPAGRGLSEYPRRIDEGLRRQAGLLASLVREQDWDVFVTWTNAVAQAQHFFLGDMDRADANAGFAGVVEHAYRSTDALVGELRKAAGEETTVFVVSDCGCGPLRAGVNVSAALESAGLLVRRRHEGVDEGDPVQALWRRIPIKRMRPDLLAWYLLPAAWFAPAARGMRTLRERAQRAVYGRDVDWSRTRAMERGIQGGVEINLAGRNPEGIVAPGVQYEEVCAEVVEALEAIVDPSTGTPVVRRVHRRAELYDGPAAHLAPDLLIEWTDHAYLPTERPCRDGSFVVPRARHENDYDSQADHRPDGVLFAAGPGIARRDEPVDLCVFDLMPSWLTLLGLPSPPHLLGRPCTNLLETGN